jgi:hypothetical protein
MTAERMTQRVAMTAKPMTAMRMTTALMTIFD